MYPFKCKKCATEPSHSFLSKCSIAPSLHKRCIIECKNTQNMENNHKNEQIMGIKYGLILETAKQAVEQRVS